MSIVDLAKLHAYKVAEQSFMNNFDCYTMVDGDETIPAMSKEKFIEIISAYLLTKRPSMDK